MDASEAFDVLADLATDLRREGLPSLAWLVRYAVDGDPLPAAWTTCEDPDALLDLASEIGLDMELHVLESCYGRGRDSAELRRQILRNVPTLTLADACGLEIDAADRRIEERRR